MDRIVDEKTRLRDLMRRRREARSTSTTSKARESSAFAHRNQKATDVAERTPERRKDREVTAPKKVGLGLVAYDDDDDDDEEDDQDAEESDGDQELPEDFFDEKRRTNVQPLKPKAEEKETEVVVPDLTAEFEALEDEVVEETEKNALEQDEMDVNEQDLEDLREEAEYQEAKRRAEQLRRNVTKVLRSSRKRYRSGDDLSTTNTVHCATASAKPPSDTPDEELLPLAPTSFGRNQDKPTDQQNARQPASPAGGAVQPAEVKVQGAEEDKGEDDDDDLLLSWRQKSVS